MAGSRLAEAHPPVTHGRQAAAGSASAASPVAMAAWIARNASGTPLRLAEESTSGARPAARFSLATWLFSVWASSASTLERATISGFSPRPPP